MAYIIYNNDGSVLLTLSDGQTDSVTTSLDLIGKNVDNYGQFYNTNLIKLLTNFASPDTASPRSPQIGQLWYNRTLNRLTVYDGTSFVPAYGTRISGTQPLTTSTGDLWFDTINNQLNLWDGKSYKLIGPPISSIYGKIGIEPPKTPLLSDNYNIPQKVSILYSYGASVGFITTETFILTTSSSITYLANNTATEVYAGLTLFDNLDVKGNVYSDGNLLMPIKSLTTVYNITSFGNPEDPLLSPASRLTIVNNGNNSIRTDIKKIFPVQTITTLSQIAYVVGSEVRVVCNYNTTVSVRRFRLEENTPGSPNWEPVNLYYNSFTQSNTNIVT